ERHARVLNLDGPTDHRRRRLERMKVYVTPLGAEADAEMDAAWTAATAGRAVHRETIPVKGREVAVPRAAGSTARFTFAELCGAPLAARDYLAIVSRFDTLFLDHIPVMGQDRRNEAKRFILL